MMAGNIYGPGAGRSGRAPGGYQPYPTHNSFNTINSMNRYPQVFISKLSFAFCWYS
jgi:hypothetical protein